ncbi:MAG: hypothetical protein KGQ59_11910, partial [Bdellovibrionales bacterium]|nr:hypothetical protein [Bdellovibrionales bacterium]
MSLSLSNKRLRISSELLQEMMGLPLPSNANLLTEIDRDLCFRRPDCSERDDILKSIIERIDADAQIVGSPERINVW